VSEVTGGYGRLAARPYDWSARPETEAFPPGMHRLGLGGERDGIVVVPDYRANEPLPLVVMLHGATGRARHMIDPFLDMAESKGFVLVAPESRMQTWDVIVGDYGPDVAFLDEVVDAVCSRLPIDSSRVGIGGFSDGASYALSLGLANGDLFTHILGLSPGFAVPPEQVGRPKIFISHGQTDRILPIDFCGRRLATMLADAGYPVRYVEFPGGHRLLPEIASESIAWFLGELDGD
jgi:phospholipase/carboxylesterase